ncbi:5-bromo-4-chloroindolyl phosphate hydrolysis protein [Alkalibacterium subtropicum]|uniref:5-bromo-4-chloroindolyl phosphate hydrolysis protein n=1 Tax=Alkalibacterium subtropicum TaxID=753702 RepID=A0A1I1ED92_9LACT|nr:5-bromo-4-chloroindolyl phosphate hydrolysis family protein [Alkalibacterium subtropicum]SFB85124.1 5-bromo-4-chloroindolyl phosphate hydrolysis protein [Alkalibacterium subtropicum]
MKHSNTRLNLTYAFILFIIMFIFLLLVGFEINIFVSFLLSIGIGVLLLNVMTKNSRGKTKEKLPRLTREKEEFYSSKGLSKEDIDYFRRTMFQAQQQIITIEENMQRSGKLRAIEHRNNTVSLAKELFKNITQEPNRLHDVDKFLYVHLPSLADLSEKYVEIEGHKAKSKTTYDILEKSAATIDKMCEQIAEDYVRFKEDDIQDMSVEVELAKRTINKDKSDAQTFDKSI